MHQDDAKIYLVSEPRHESTYWYMRLLQGIAEQSARKNITVVHIDIGALEEIAMSGRHPCNPAIIFGATISWLNSACDVLRRYGMRNVIVGSGEQVFRRNTAAVALSHRESTYDLVNYMVRAGRKKIALFAHNPRSINDREKFKGYSEAASINGLQLGSDDLVIFEGSIEACIRNFRERAHKYDSVICSNDTSGIALINAAPELGIRIPEDMYVAGFGNTYAAKLTEPTLTSATLDYYEAGKLALDASLYLRRNNSVLSCFTFVKCEVFPRGSTEYREAKGSELPAHYLKLEGEGWNGDEDGNNDSFYIDRHVQNILRLEGFLHGIDKTDTGILEALAQGKTYEKLSEELNMSDTMLKYRIKKMLQLSGMSTRQELLANINQYLGSEAVKKMGSGLFGKNGLY